MASIARNNRYSSETMYGIMNAGTSIALLDQIDNLVRISRRKVGENSGRLTGQELAH